jgi:hypothetical protein
MKEALHALEEVKQAIQLAYSSGYSAAKQHRKWVGLTDEERDSITGKVIGWNSCCGWEDAYAQAIEAKLKEKNDH